MKFTCQNYFLFLGVLRYYKGLHVLLKSVIKTNIQVVIAGDGPEKKSLLRYKEEMKLDNVIFVGTVTENEKYYLIKNCDALVFPSIERSEAFGISLIEALSYGKPLITTNIGTGTNFININNVTGISVEPNNSNELKKAMEKFSQNEDFQKLTSINTSKRYKRYFT